MTDPASKSQKSLVAFKGATMYEVQVGRVWATWTMRRYRQSWVPRMGFGVQR